MTDAEFDAIKSKCEHLFGLWKTRLDLHQWAMFIDYYRHSFDTDDDSDARDAAMDISPDWRYLKADIRVNVWNIHESESTEDQIEMMVVHELCHILVNELRTEVPEDEITRHLNHEERVVSMLAKTFYRAYSGAA